MANITASMVKELREKTGAGMMDCKAALTENNGDMEAAVDWLRTKGLAKAAKKASRVAAEGLVGVAADGTTGAAVEINSETDFVARNEQFQDMVSTVANIALGSGGDVDALKSADYPGVGKSVADQVTELVGTIGENMNVRRTASISVEKGVIASYVHNQVSAGLGKIGVLVGIETEGDEAAASAFGKQVAMHVAAANPLLRWCLKSSTRTSSSVSALSTPNRPVRAASRKTSSKRWSMAACASSTKNPFCCRRLSSSMARTPLRRPQNSLPRASARRSRSPASSACSSAKASTRARKRILLPK